MSGSGDNASTSSLCTGNSRKSLTDSQSTGGCYERKRPKLHNIAFPPKRRRGICRPRKNGTLSSLRHTSIPNSFAGSVQLRPTFEPAPVYQTAHRRFRLRECKDAQTWRGRASRPSSPQHPSQDRFAQFRVEPSRRMIPTREEDRHPGARRLQRHSCSARDRGYRRKPPTNRFRFQCGKRSPV